MNNMKNEFVLVVKFYVVLLICCGVFGYLTYQINSYHEWVKTSTIDGYGACRAFNEGAEGEKYCKEYAKGPVWSPYPFWKSLVLINPN